MHQLSDKIFSVVDIQRCDHEKVDKCVEEYLQGRLKWLEDGDGTLQRIRQAFGFGDRNIKENKIRCKTCGDIITSDYRHDFKTCKCGLVSVDGGTSYLRRSFQNKDYYEELSTYA